MISSNGVPDIGGDAIGAATGLLKRLREESRLGAGTSIPLLSLRGQVGAQVTAPSPVRFFAPRMVDAEPCALPAFALTGMNVLYLSDASSDSPKSQQLMRVVPSADSREPQIRCGDEADLLPLPEALARIGAEIEAIVLTIDGSRYGPDALLTDQLNALSSLLNALFAIVRHVHTRVSERSVRVGTLVYNAWDDGVLNPLSGLFAGFIKSLRRDFPQSFLAAAVSDVPLGPSLPILESELAQERRDEILPEIFLRRGLRLREALAPTDTLFEKDERRLFSAGAVVIATGGARGVTAILVEDLLRRYGCRVVALGRTGTDGVPEDVLAMNEAQLRDYETEFYRLAAASGRRKSPAEMKREFDALASSNEVYRTIQSLKAAGGSFEYIRVDITDAEALDAVIADIYKRYGKVDVVIHGAGTQISKRIAKKTLDEFDLVVSSKLAGLRCLHAAVARHAGSQPADFHVLTSAFSFWGNDGQPDYGAANEALNRLAAAKTSPNGVRGSWSTLAWLAWPMVGMAKEFSWLASQRPLHPLAKGEGQALFRALSERAPAQATNILATPNEIAYFSVPVAETNVRLPARSETFELSPSEAPYIEDHVVDGVQTVPGAAEFFTACSVALRLLPGMRVEALHNCRFRTFLRRYADRPNNARIFARVLHEDPSGATVRVRICSDFIHPSGRVLKENVEHFCADVTCARTAALAAAFDVVEAPGTQTRIEDPYICRTPALQLKGMFDCLRGIRLASNHQFAELALSEAVRKSPLQSMLVPTLALDALARLGTMLKSGDSVAICVPVAATSLRFHFDFCSNELFELFQGAQFIGTKPEQGNDRSATLHMERMWAVTRSGQPLMEINRSVAKILDFVPLETLLPTTRS